jgi:hypothetical protein
MQFTMLKNIFCFYTQVLLKLGDCSGKRNKYALDSFQIVKEKEKQTKRKNDAVKMIALIE